MKSLSDQITWTRAEPLYQVKADMFKGLAHPVRVRVLEVVAAHDEVPVADLVEITGLDPAHLSQHLAILRRHGLVASERRASFVYYRLTTPVVAELLRVARRFLIERLEDAQDRMAASESLPDLGGRP